MVDMQMIHGFSVGCDTNSTTSVNTNVAPSLEYLTAQQDQLAINAKAREKKLAPRRGWKNDRPRNGQPWER
jgi:hypothetical protein